MSDVRRLCIIPCGSAKIWDSSPNAGPQKAKDVYTGVFAKASQRYAELFFDNWVILSAKHGFLHPQDIIHESYNVSFIKPNSETIRLETLQKQAAQDGLLGYPEITVLGGKHYVERVQAIFNNRSSITLPLSDCKGIGFMLQKLSIALESGREVIADDAGIAKLSEPRIRTAAKAISKSTSNIGKYIRFYDYLRLEEGTSLVISIDQIEEILGFLLPPSYFKHRAWWSNDITHSHAKAWLLAEWEVENVSLPNITFRKSAD